MVGLVAVMVFTALFGTIGVSFVASANGSQNNVIQAAQALAIAQAGAEWYLEQLQNDTDWTNEVAQNRSFAEGAFAISLVSTAATEVRFTSTGTVTSNLTGINIQRAVTLTAQKMPSSFRFALFQGVDPGASFTLTTNVNPTVVTGDVWSAGTVAVNAGNSVTQGTVYVPNTKDVTGPGSYTKKLIDTPFPAMPVIVTTPYVNQINGFNTTLDANTSTTDLTLSTGTFTVSGTMNYRNITTNGNVIINGSGTLNANGDMLLHGSNGLGTTTSLAITPTVGGSIAFLANRSILLGSNNNNPTITVGSGCTFYSRSLTATGQFLQIRGSRTSVTNALLLGRRRISVETGADVASSTLFVSYPGSATSNLLDIRGGSGVTSVSGTLISISEANPAIRVSLGTSARNEVSVSGLIYAYTATNGYCQLDDATIQGSVVCNRFNSNRIRNVAITYNASVLPSPPPQGFDGFATQKENNWDGF